MNPTQGSAVFFFSSFASSSLKKNCNFKLQLFKMSRLFCETEKQNPKKSMAKLHNEFLC